MKQSIKCLKCLCVALFAVGACSRAGIDVKVTEIEASLPGASSKLNFSDIVAGKVGLLWSEGDRLSLNGTLSSAVDPSDAGKPKGHFTFNGTFYGPYNFLYPASEGSDNTVSFDSQTTPLYAGTYDLNSVSLTSCASVFQFSLTGKAQIKSIVLSATGGEKIFGTFTMGKTDGKLDGSLTASQTSKSEAVREFQTPLQLSGTATKFIFAVPAGSYSEGFSLKICDNDSGAMTLKFFGAGRTLSGSSYYLFPEKSYAAGTVSYLAPAAEYDTESVKYDDTSATIINPMSSGSSDDDMSLIKIGAFNIWSSLSRQDYIDNYAVKKMRCWRQSRAAVAKAIINLDCDVYCLQEFDDTVFGKYAAQKPYSLDQTLKNEGGKYTLLVKSDYWNAYKFAPGIAYKAETVTPVGDPGYFWLTETKTSTSFISPDGVARMCYYQKFKHIASGKQFYAFSTHLSTFRADTKEHDDVNIVNARYLVKYVRETAGSTPYFVAGDMNAASVHTSYPVLTEYWKDAYNFADECGVLPAIEKLLPATCPGVKMDSEMTSEGGRIDHIYLSPGISIHDYFVSKNTFRLSDGNFYYPSDHAPVIASISID